MDGEVYDRAVGRIEELRAELQRLQSFVSTYRELAEEAEEPTPMRAASRQKIVAFDHRENGDNGTAPARTTPQTELERVVEDVLMAHGAPLRRAELLEHLKARGLVIGGRNEMTNLGSKLSRAQGLVNLPKLGYWPKALPFPSSGYLPSSESLSVVL